MQRAKRTLRAAQHVRASASTRAYDLMNVAVVHSQSTVVDAGLNASHKIVTPIVRYHVSALLGGTDPALPNSVRTGIDLLAEDVCVDVEIKILEALRQNVGGKTDAAKFSKQESLKCCRPNCCSYIRASMLYTLYPYDRSIWSQLRDPWFYILKLLTIFPMFYISMSFWFFLWILKDKRDEYTLVKFIVDLKSSLFISAVINSVLGNIMYLRCTTIDPTAVPCHSNSPGQMQPFWPVAGFFVLQLVLTFVSTMLNCCSLVKGKHAKQKSDKLGRSALVLELETETRRRRSRIFCWIVYDIVAVAIVCAIVVLAIATEATYGSGGVNNITSTNILHTPEQHIPRDLAEVLYWCRVLYGWLCFPWLLLLLPGMFPLLTHTKATGYTRDGRTVPIASALVRLQNFQWRREKNKALSIATTGQKPDMEMNHSNPLPRNGADATANGNGKQRDDSTCSTAKNHRKTNSNNPFKK